MHISITDELKKRFHATCVMQGKKMSQVVIELIEQWLESNEVFQTKQTKTLEASTQLDNLENVKSK
ncbi:hypothetical protein ICL16_44005 [Iningainema sp. BLCCT55]|uniref:Uncharacterized protein n=1 Tax=Iningainema tapete BLCC-T55 TaxID=2748662 RepID=A0A8J7CBX0_9CYAN|nr:hypothetical protein [Iningainema tapete BLCC-T55]